MLKFGSMIFCLMAALVGWASPLRLSVFHCHVVTMAEQQKVSVAEAARAVRSWGVEGVDVLNAPVGTPAVEAILAAGLKPVSYIVFTDFGASDSTQMVERAFANVRKYGFERVMLVPGFTPKGKTREAAWQEARPRLAGFLARAKAENVTVEVEDFDAKNILLGSPEHLREAFSLFPDLGHVLDTGNYAFWKWDVRQGLREFRSRIRHVHIKDRDRVNPKRSVAHGTGAMPIREVVEELLRSGYAGWFTVECFGSKCMWKDIENSVKFLKSIKVK